MPPLCLSLASCLLLRIVSQHPARAAHRQTHREHVPRVGVQDSVLPVPPPLWDLKPSLKQGGMSRGALHLFSPRSSNRCWTRPAVGASVGMMASCTRPCPAFLLEEWVGSSRALPSWADPLPASLPCSLTTLTAEDVPHSQYPVQRAGAEAPLH